MVVVLTSEASVVFMPADCVAAFVQSRINAGCRDSSIAHYKRVLDVYIKYVNTIGDITPDSVKQYIAGLLSAGLRNTTVEGRRIVVVTFCTWLGDSGIIEAHDWKKTIPHLRVDRPMPRHLSAEECRLFLLTAEHMPYVVKAAHERNLAMLYLFLDTGLRIGELINLELQDVDLTRRVCVVRDTKSRSDRVVTFSKESVRRIKSYLRLRKPGAKKLFSVSGEPLGRSTIRKYIDRVANRAGIPKVYPHALRHTFATLAIENGIPVTSLQVILGHSRLPTTMRYVHMTNETALRDADKASVIGHLRL